MNTFTFKYYPPKPLLIIVCIIIAILLPIKFLIFHLFGKVDFYSPTFQNITIYIFLSVGALAFFLNLINKKLMFKWYLNWLKIPDIRGNYSGTLKSSYHINDDPVQPNITKNVKIEISQNLNGFYVKSSFYDSEFHTQESSSSESISHDIEPKDNGEYLIIYRYRNTGNNFHDDHIKYNLNKHDGIAQLYFNPTNKTLIGKYFNDSQDRPSYGTLKLNKI